MRNIAMIGAAALGIALGACAPKDQVRDPIVEDLWVRLPAASGRPAAAYFTLRGGTYPAVLKSVSSPDASSVEIHESRMEGGVMRMTPLEDVEVPADAEVSFEPGGRHLMLFGISPTLRPGTLAKIQFEFEPRVEIVAEAEVRPAGAAIEH